jgi:hypothetical protein
MAAVRHEGGQRGGTWVKPTACLPQAGQEDFESRGRAETESEVK